MTLLPMTHMGSAAHVDSERAPCPPVSPSSTSSRSTAAATWVTDPDNTSTITDSSGNTNNLKAPLMCMDPDLPGSLCPGPGVFDWRDADHLLRLRRPLLPRQPELEPAVQRRKGAEI